MARGRDEQGRDTVPSREAPHNSVRTRLPYNPAFDVTPAGLITAIVTEHRVFRPGSPGAAH